jgi:hypothetical protein
VSDVCPHSFHKTLIDLPALPLALN